MAWGWQTYGELKFIWYWHVFGSDTLTISFLFPHLRKTWNIKPEWWVRVMVFNGTFNNISVTLWQLVLLVEESRVPGDNHRPATSHWQTLSDNVVLSTMSGIRTDNVSVDRHWLHRQLWIQDHDHDV